MKIDFVFFFLLQRPRINEQSSFIIGRSFSTYLWFVSRNDFYFVLILIIESGFVFQKNMEITKW